MSRSNRRRNKQVDEMPVEETEAMVETVEEPEVMVESDEVVETTPDTVEEAETETIPEEKVEEVEESNSYNLATAKEVITFLTGKELSDVDKLSIVAKEAGMPFSMLVASLNRYANEVGGNAQVTEALGCKYNHDLYVLISNVLKEEDQDIYTAKMKLIALVFKVNNNNAFSEVMLHRFTKKWTWGKESLNTYLYIVTIFTMLSDPAKRQDNLKYIKINDIIDSDDNLLDRNIVAFFEN